MHNEERALSVVGTCVLSTQGRADLSREAGEQVRVLQGMGGLAGFLQGWAARVEVRWVRMGHGQAQRLASSWQSVGEPALAPHVSGDDGGCGDGGGDGDGDDVHVTCQAPEQVVDARCADLGCRTGLGNTASAACGRGDGAAASPAVHRGPELPGHARSGLEPKLQEED